MTLLLDEPPPRHALLQAVAQRDAKRLSPVSLAQILVPDLEFTDLEISGKAALYPVKKQTYFSLSRQTQKVCQKASPLHFGLLSGSARL